MKQLILASGSPRRLALMKQIGLSFSVKPSNADESNNAGLEAPELVRDLALRKAADVAGSIRQDALVIGADTVVVKDRILGKPADDSEAFEMLKFLQGQWHQVMTGIALYDALSGHSTAACEITKVKIRDMTDDMIWSYVKTGEPADKAGAYGIQGMGAVLVERIEGCYSNVVGLPLMLLCRMLEEFNVKVLR